MSKITKNNYEAYLLDYVEQTLSPDMVAELMLFLEQNLELKAELDDFENIAFTINDAVNFENKQDLKQLAIEELMIAEIEGLNSAEQSKELQQEIKENSTYTSLFTNYQKTILVPENIVFEDKTVLKQKETKVIPLHYWYSSVAAVLVVAFTLSPFITGNENQFAVDTRMFPVNNNQQFENEINTIQEVKVVQENESLANVEKIKTTNSQNLKQTYLKNSTPNTNSSTPIPQHPILNTQPSTKELITINPPKKEYIEIEPFVAEEKKAKQQEYLTVAELLKKEAQKRLLENEVTTNSNELMAANVVAKVLGNNADVETTKDANGEVNEYALNIGGFSISRKIRK